ELLAVIVILAVLAVITVVIIGNVIEDAKIKKYYSEEKAMERAAELYLLKNQNALGNGVESQVITLQQLMDAKTMKAVHDTGNGGLCDTSESKVIVTSSTNPKKVTYKGCLKCSNYKTSGEECGYKAEQEEEEIVDAAPCELATETIKSKTYYYVDSEEDLYALSKSVNDGHDYSGEIVEVRKNLDMSKTISGETKTICDTKGVSTTSFTPIGTSSKPFKGTFEGMGKTISKLTINLPNQDYVGLFGYNGGVIRGLNLVNVNITGKNYVGGVSGNIKSPTGVIAKIQDIAITGSVKGNDYVGGITGELTDSSTITDILSNMNVDGRYYVGGLIGYKSENSVLSGIIEGGAITAEGYANYGANSRNYCSSVYTSTSVTLNGTNMYLNGEGSCTGKGFPSEYVGILNGYDQAIDTYLGGDNNSNEYYYDYDSKGKIKVVSTSDKPIPSISKLSGSGTSESPYEIDSVEDWNIAVAYPKNYYYKLTNDIDFNNKKFYMLGSVSNTFTGTLEGNAYKIKNATVEGMNYTGLIGYLNGTVKGINIENVSAEGNNYVGGVAGYIKSPTDGTAKIQDIAITGNIKGNSYVGGITGRLNDNSIITNILSNMNVDGVNDVGGLIGSKDNGTLSAIIEGGAITATGYDYNYGGYSRNLCSSVRTSTSVTLNGINMYLNGEGSCTGKGFSNIYDNNLGYYGSTLGQETPQTGDTNESGYYFDYNGDASDIIVVKAYQPSSDDDQHATTDVTPITYTNESCSDKVAPTCTLTSFAPRSQSDGMTASFECTDNVDVEKISSYFHSTRKNTAESFDMIGTEKTITATDKIAKGARHYSIWTAQTDPNHAPSPNTCYYFHYGAKDACGNYTAYVTNYCLSY
ncbi:MAG: hypothetical protein IJ134_03305, partial [Bacilli bacterium]|nr:hypothetical protein [Bacilli bacterium]